MKCNLGCNDKYIDGFVNIDMNPDCVADVIGDVSDLDKIPELQGISISEIVAYDIIEHFDRYQYSKVLKNWFDHLAPGGILYIRTNDLDRMIKLYQDHPKEYPAALFIWHLMCEHEKPGMGHKWCFTKQLLFSSLIDAGFRKIRITPEPDISIGNYPYAFTTIDYCNMHLTAEKI
jgi:predicted SAM-dependent methyltransferase